MLFKTDSTNPYYAYKDFAKGEEITFLPDDTQSDQNYQNNQVDTNLDHKYREFYLGFYLPGTWGSRTWGSNSGKKYTSAEIDEISTWLLNQTDRDFSMDVKFILEITQK